MNIKEPNPVLLYKYIKVFKNSQVHAKKKAEDTPIPDLTAFVRTQVLLFIFIF